MTVGGGNVATRLVTFSLSIDASIRDGIMRGKTIQWKTKRDVAIYHLMPPGIA